MTYRARITIALLALTYSYQFADADNGHLIGTSNTETHRIAIFAEPWPARVGELQMQYIITDTKGNLVRDDSTLTSPLQKTITLTEPGLFVYESIVFGIAQPPISFEVLPKASIVVAYWNVWIFLIFGFIFIILREKLANTHARRYPSL